MEVFYYHLLFYKQNWFLRNYILTSMIGTVTTDHDIKMQWNELLKDLLRLCETSCTLPYPEGCWTHGFCHSCGQSYCSVVFVRTMFSYGMSVNLRVGYCLFTFMRNFSIARLELLSFLLLSKLILQWLLRQLKLSWRWRNCIVGLIRKWLFGGFLKLERSGSVGFKIGFI